MTKLRHPTGGYHMGGEPPHQGKIDDTEALRANCRCKWIGPKRHYQYEARGDLYAHYETINPHCRASGCGNLAKRDGYCKTDWIRSVFED